MSSGSQNNYTLPSATIKAKTLAGNEPPKPLHNQRLDRTIERIETQSKILETYRGIESSTLRTSMEEYYARGINILKPEIVMTHELIPIRKDFDDTPGLQVQAGNRKVSVNQVFKLIELHHSVQNAMNVASIEFLKENAGFDIEAFYFAAREYYDNDIIMPTLSESVNSFKNLIKSEIIPYHDGNDMSIAEQIMHGGRGSNYGYDTMSNTETERAQDGLNTSGEPGVIFKLDEEPKMAKQFPFRSIITQGSEVQKATIDRVLEIIILENITVDLFDFFANIVDLKEIQIPKSHDITKLANAQKAINSNSLNNSSKKAINSLRNSFTEPVSESEEIATLMNPSNSETYLGPFKHVEGDSLARKGLGVQSIALSDNYTVIYSLFVAIMKSLTFNTPGKLTNTFIEGKKSKLKNVIQNDMNGVNVPFSKKIRNFFERTGMSSFIGSNSVRIPKGLETAPSTLVFTSDLINRATLNADKPYAITHSRLQASIRLYSMPGDDLDHYYGNPEVLRPINGLPNDDLAMAGELLSAAIFDTCFLLNNRKYNTDSFNNPITVSFDQYMINVLGPDALSYINSYDNPPDKQFDIDDAVEYSNPKTTTVQNELGLLGDALFSEKKILNGSVSCLPGSSRNYPSLNKTLDGKLSIPLEAFSDASFDSLEEYIKDLESLTNKTFKDIGRLFSVFKSSTYGGQTTGRHDPDFLFRKILLRLSEQLDNIIDDIGDNIYHHTVDTHHKRRGFSLATAIVAGGDDHVLSNFFVSHYLRKSGYFASAEGRSKKWIAGMRNDAANGVIWHIFKKIMGKNLQTVAGHELVERGVEHYYRGNFLNYFLQAKPELADEDFFTFLNNARFNGSTYFLGREIDEDDFETWEKFEVKYKNNHKNLLDPAEDSVRDSEYSIMTEPVEAIHDFIKDLDRSYANSLKGQVGSDFVKYDSRNTDDSVAVGDSMPKEYAYIFERRAETPGKFGHHSMFKSSDVQREYAAFAFICKLLNRTLTVKFKFNSDKSLGLIFSKKQLMALRDAIRNSSLLSDTAKQRYNAAGALGYDGASEVSNARLESSQVNSVLSESKRPLLQRLERVKVCYAAIYTHLDSLNLMKEEIKRRVSDSALSTPAKLAINYYGLTNDAETDGNLFPTTAQRDIESFNARQSLLFYLSSKTVPMFYKNYYDTIQKSKDNFAYASYENISEKQIYQMKLALSGENYGNASSEKLGKKTILSVGIPPGQLFQLGLNAQSSQGEPSYFNSPYICIHIFKKDGLGGDILYYPKPFIFNSSVVSIENFDSTFTAQPNPLHEEEFESIRSFEDLLEKFSLYKFRFRPVGGGHMVRSFEKFEDYEKLLLDSYDLAYINNSSAGSRSATLQEMKINHMQDHYLKMYMKMTTGIDLSELAFPLDEHNRLKGAVDPSVSSLFASYENNLFLRYPSINVDPILAREYKRLERNIASSRFFSLNEKIKNVFSAKAFERIYNVFINEADFVVYPYPDIISEATKAFGGSLFDSLINTQAFVDSLPSLYDPCPYFNLNSQRQIYGVNNVTKAKLAYDLGQSAALGYTNISEGNLNSSDKFLSGKYRQFFKHINEIESENVSDVYEFFAVVSVIRRS